MDAPVGRSKRWAAIAAIVCLVLGFPVLIVLSAVLDDGGGPLVQGMLGLLVALTFAGWLWTLVAKRNAAAAAESTEGPDPSG